MITILFKFSFELIISSVIGKETLRVGGDERGGKAGKLRRGLVAGLFQKGIILGLGFFFFSEGTRGSSLRTSDS